MGARTKESQKKSKIIFLIILIAAIISITGTYAWFSSQRDVEIVGFRINVEIAENLEISLDGETWTHSIKIEDMRQLYGTYIDETEDTPVYQAKSTDQRNYIPIELLPVSTIGTVKDGNLVFVKGDIKEKKLDNIVKCSEADIENSSSEKYAGKSNNEIIKSKEDKNEDHPYLAFDMYLKNLSRLAESENEKDPLQLNEGSIVTAGNKDTGLEYSIRVGLVQYAQTVTLVSTGAEARAIQASANDVAAIWEPNYRLHIPFVVANDDRVSSLVENVDTYGIDSKIVDDAPEPEEGQEPAPIVIEDITDTENQYLKKVYTNKPPQSEVTATQEFQTTDVLNLLQVDGTTPLALKPNTITKVRVYIWLEGQDPDCVDLASTGDEVIATLRLIKPPSGKVPDNSYQNQE